MTADTKSEIAMLRRQADGLDNEIADLERRYGKGTRPAFVGNEIAIMAHRAKLARDKAIKLEVTLP